MFVNETARGCGAVDMRTLSVKAYLTLANVTAPIRIENGYPSNGIHEWTLNHTYTYPASAMGDQPQAWNMSVHLIVPHDELLLDNFVDDCVHAAVTDLKLEAIDHDFKP